MQLHDAEEVMTIRIILLHDIRMKKNLLIFTEFYGLWRCKVQLAPQDRNFISGVAKPKIFYMLFRF